MVYTNKVVDIDASKHTAQLTAMLKLSAAAKNAGNSYLSKQWTVIVLLVGLAYAVATLMVPKAINGMSRK